MKIKKILLLTIGGIITLFVVYVLLLVITHVVNENKIANDPTLYKELKIINEFSVEAEDGKSFQIKEVKIDFPNPGYRFYVFKDEKSYDELFFVDSEKRYSEIKVRKHIETEQYNYYVIEGNIIYIDKNTDDYKYISSEALNAINKEDNDYKVLYPIVKKLVEEQEWIWIYDGAEFLLQADEKDFVLRTLQDFEKNNEDKKQKIELYHFSELTYEKMLQKCQELLNEYGG